MKAIEALGGDVKTKYVKTMIQKKNSKLNMLKQSEKGWIKVTWASELWEGGSLKR